MTYGCLFPTLWARRQQCGANPRAHPSTPEHTHGPTRGLVPRGAETQGSAPTVPPRRGLAPSPQQAPGGLSRIGGRRSCGVGHEVPGDFTLFEARVFRDRRCHSGGFSFLLHWHLPPSPARWTGRPGRGVALRRSSGSRLPGTAAEARGATPRRPGPGSPPRGRPGTAQRLARRYRGSGAPGAGNADSAAPPAVWKSRRLSLTRKRMTVDRK